ncbi:hypothetical protein VE23_21560 [Paenibacillus sp. D9]|uniref:hypothetical protein n=1 Tax=Paenibacillus sp. D9 TaxID=665792 RepID=UPI00061F1E9D|nr:hypothetical protein [Paenibacillus sp. D9]KKC49079.1 hypothetical protein VE23_21560 [Paenibacillus sp. D9]
MIRNNPSAIIERDVGASYELVWCLYGIVRICAALCGGRSNRLESWKVSLGERLDRAGRLDCKNRRM